MRRLERGSSLATTLMVAALILVVTFALVASAVTHVSLTNTREAQELARNAAESVMATALARLNQAVTFDDEVGVVLENATARATIDNNIQSDTADGDVPPRCARIRSEGRSRTITHRMEALVEFELEVPLALQADGKIQLAAATIRGQDVVAGVGTNDNLELVNSSVQGDAIAGRQVTNQGSTVDGATRSEAPTMTLARPVFDDFTAKARNILLPRVNPVVPSGIFRSTRQSFVGIVRLNRSVLLGDFISVESGCVRGVGLIVCTNDIVITSQTAQPAPQDTDNVALVANRISLSGVRPQDNRHRGLVSANQLFVFSHATEGAAVAGGPPPPPQNSAVVTFTPEFILNKALLDFSFNTDPINPNPTLDDLLPNLDAELAADPIQFVIRSTAGGVVIEVVVRPTASVRDFFNEQTDSFDLAAVNGQSIRAEFEVVRPPLGTLNRQQLLEEVPTAQSQLAAAEEFILGQFRTRLAELNSRVIQERLRLTRPETVTVKMPVPSAQSDTTAGSFKVLLWKDL